MAESRAVSGLRAQVVIFLIWDALLLLAVYAIVVHFGSPFWQQRWYIPVVASGAVLVAVEAGWSAYQLRAERRDHPATNADVTAGLLASDDQREEPV